MDELREMVSADVEPLDIRLSRLPSCLLASLIGVVVDVLLITVVALYKSPFMLFKGWKRLLEDLVGREGPFLETVCVPFAGLAILLWPLAVVGAVIASVISSFFLGMYSGVIVHQEDSFRMGLNYIIAAVSLFDEYVNDLLYLREGTRLPRPCYRTKIDAGHGKRILRENVDLKSRRSSSLGSRLVSEQSRTLKNAITLYKPVQVWEWLFKSCEVNGRILLRDGLIDVKDVEECLVKGNCKKLHIKLPAWTVLQCLLASAKSNSSGLVITDGVELTELNSPRDKVFVWLVRPLLIMKEQITNLKLTEDEEFCLRKLVMVCKNERTEDWDSARFPSSDTVRKAQLQAIIRRLQGMVASMARIPTFRRRFMNLVKVLYIEALEIGASGNRASGILKQTGNLDGTGTTKMDLV
ncbi:putative membrane protein [Cardamine amara subsp. amara]|uniref:Membrane protein n=1 Tax=Cardamine amara subsp. amara TaxID=228776 RepID=A0ABD0Z662_CARAN